MPENWCFWTVVLDKTLENPLDCKENKPVSPKGSQPWIFIGRIDAESEAPILWSPDLKSQLIGKDLDARENWRQKENEMTGLDGIVNTMNMSLSNLWEIVKDREGCPCGHKESDMTEWLNKSNISSNPYSKGEYHINLQIPGSGDYWDTMRNCLPQEKYLDQSS